MLEFTGERVIAGLGDQNLFNEHLARYRFASQFTKDAAVLDCGCGGGYGSAELRDARYVIGIDNSANAVRHASLTYGSARVHFVEAACESMPFSAESFDVVIAFEVIEHLERWRGLLTEARRVLRQDGIFLISTPDKISYAESRGAAGPNPFHVHEFEHEEFVGALESVFPQVAIWHQYRTESFVFNPPGAARGAFETEPDRVCHRGDFFIGLCSKSTLPAKDPYVWIPANANLLRDRERHIALLESEVSQKNRWLEQLKQDHARLNETHTGTVRELEQRNQWAGRLNDELGQAAQSIRDLQNEIKSSHAPYHARIQQMESEIGHLHLQYQNKIQELEQELKSRLEWITDLESQIERGHDQIGCLTDELNSRTEWALALDRQLEQARHSLQSVNSSVWGRLGRVLRLSPPANGS